MPKLAASAETSCFKNERKQFTFVVANGEKVLEVFTVFESHTVDSENIMPLENSLWNKSCYCFLAFCTSRIFLVIADIISFRTCCSFAGWFAISSSLFCSLFKIFTANPVAWSLLALQLWPSPLEAEPMPRKHPDRALQMQSVVAQPLVPISAMTIKIFIP